jgi:hypothetical protein
MAGKGDNWKDRAPLAPKGTEHRQELAMQAVRLTGAPANHNAYKPGE